ncbi:MAG: DNA polymerase, partial [Candidatus Latescibacteria bacterium]|nr:DNA polymerase [Candidatus Latescibacterota bacterium]
MPNVELELVHEYLGPLLADPEIVKIGQNVKYDLTILEGAGFECKGFTADTMIASYLVDPGERRHNLDRLALDLLGHEMIPIKGLIGTGQRQITFDKVGVAQAVPYACEDADYTFRIFEVLEPQLNSPELRSLFDDMEMPLVTCLLRMEQNGITLDAPFLEEMAKELTTEIERLSQEIYTHAGEQFNLNSTQQLAQILFEKLKLPYGRKTKTGYSTDETVLQDLVASGHGDRLPQLLLEYRQLSKLLSTYVEALPLLVNPNTGRVHTSFNQAVASTGRLSSSDPNLQNIPIRTEMGSRVRQAFIPREGWVLMAADYSQIELRIMAHLSGDPGLLDAFTKDEDVHTRTASAIFDLDPGFVTDDLRRQAKTVNFGLIYGQSAFGLSRQLGIAGPKAAKIIDQYFAQYPGVRGYMDRAIEQARTEGYVTTMLGRRRYIPELSQRNKNVQRAGERLAINTPIQGTAADMMKVALIAVDLDLAASDLRASML